MTQKNSEEKVFDLVRPLYQHKLNRFGIPIMNKITEDRLNFANVQPLNVQNLSMPCVGWTTEEWDDLSFAGIEIGSVVVISTLGCKRDVDFFMRGYNEMIRRIKPPLIIVYRDMLPEKIGRFVNFRYEDSFQPKIPCCVHLNAGDFSFVDGGKTFRSIGDFDNVKILVKESGSVKAPEFSHTAGRIYAIVQDGKLKHLAYYDENHKQAVSIDLQHAHH